MVVSMPRLAAQDGSRCRSARLPVSGSGTRRAARMRGRAGATRRRAAALLAVTGLLDLDLARVEQHQAGELGRRAGPWTGPW